jgi:hypothetical protein
VRTSPSSWLRTASSESRAPGRSAWWSASTTWGATRREALSRIGGRCHEWAANFALWGPRREDDRRELRWGRPPAAQRRPIRWVFGLTGDLAHKMIFPALDAMAKRDVVNVPVVGVASSPWSVAQLRTRAADAIRKGDRIDDARSLSEIRRGSLAAAKLLRAPPTIDKLFARSSRNRRSAWKGGPPQREQTDVVLP